MNHLDILVRTILLLLLEKKHNNNIESIAISKKVLEVIKNKRVKSINNRIAESLQNLLNEIINTGVTDVDSFISSLELSLSDNPTLVDTINKQILIPFDNKAQAYRRHEISVYIKKENASMLLGKYFMLSKNSTTNLKRLSGVIDELQEVLEYMPLENEAVMDSVDFNNDDDVNNMVDSATAMYENANVLKTGWACLNDMLGGGVRRGEMMSIAALPHNYKSGLTKSLLLQLARLNTPVLDDSSKKPLIVFFSVEEEIKVVMLFIYAYFKFLYEGVIIDPSKDDIDSSDMKSYLKKHMRPDNGYHIKIIRLHPSKTTVNTIESIVNKLEQSGYEIHAVLIDYLSQISKEGCDRSGPMGSEYKDLFKRTRTLFSGKKIACITPHQISPEGKKLIRNGIPDIEFVKHLPGKGYYASSSQLDQELDVELFIHKAYVNRKPVLTIQRGKLRAGIIIDPDKLYAILDYPKDVPIPEDTAEKTYCRESTSELDGFDF